MSDWFDTTAHSALELTITVDSTTVALVLLWTMRHPQHTQERTSAVTHPHHPSPSPYVYVYVSDSVCLVSMSLCPERERERATDTETERRKGRGEERERVSVSGLYGITTLGNAHTRSARLSAVSPKLPSKQYQGLVEDRSFPTSEAGMSAAFFFISSFLQAINAVMLWPVPIQKVLASLSTRSFPLTPTCTWQLILRSLCCRRRCMAVCQSGQPIPDPTFCNMFIESVRTV